MINIWARVRETLDPIAAKHGISLDDAADVLFALLNADVRYIAKEIKAEEANVKNGRPMGRIAALVREIAVEKDITHEDAVELLRAMIDPAARAGMTWDTVDKSTTTSSSKKSFVN